MRKKLKIQFYKETSVCFLKKIFFCSKSAFLSGTVFISYNIRRLLKLVYKVKGYTLEYNLHSKRILFSLSLRKICNFRFIFCPRSQIPLINMHLCTSSLYFIFCEHAEDETTYVYNQIRIGQNMRTVTYVLLIVRKQAPVKHLSTQDRNRNVLHGKEA